MKIKEIAIFKRFMVDNTVRDIFIRKYNGERSETKNPTWIEDYLSNVDHTEVIKKAFVRYKMNSAFGFDFWDRLNEDWLVYYNKKVKNHDYSDTEKLLTLTGFFSILRENWNSTKPWVYESVGDALARLALTPQAYTPKDADNSEPKPADPPTEKPEEKDDLDIDFIEVAPSRKTYKLKSGMMSVNIRKKSTRCLVNHIDSQNLINKNLDYVRMGKTSNDVVIQFNNKQGINCNVTSDAYVSIGNSDFTRQLHNLLSLSGDLNYVRIEKISENLDSVTYRIIKL